MSNRFEHKNNTGSLFKNPYKTKDKHPDYNGTAKIDGKEIDIGAWIRTDKNGQKYFGFTFEIIEPEPESEPEPETPQPDINDEIPF